jgi:hypothetical protein
MQPSFQVRRVRCDVECGQQGGEDQSADHQGLREERRPADDHLPLHRKVQSQRELRSSRAAPTGKIIIFTILNY